MAELSEDIRQALGKHKSAGSKFEALPPSHRREYLQWIDGAKKSATRVRRIEEFIERLSSSSK